MPRVSRRSWAAEEVIAKLSSHADPKIASVLQRRNPEAVILGVRFGDIGIIEKQIEPDVSLAAELWSYEAMEARTLALRVLPRGSLTDAQVGQWVTELNYPTLTDEFTRAVFHTPGAKDWMERWIDDPRDYVRRAGYGLMYGFAAEPGNDIHDEQWQLWLLKITDEIHVSPNWAREIMNVVPVAIGLGNPRLFEAAQIAATTYSPIEVFHGDATNCKIPNPLDLLIDPRTRIKRY